MGGTPPAFFGGRKNKKAYDIKANKLANSFIENFKQFIDQANKEIKEAAPKPNS